MTLETEISTLVQDLTLPFLEEETLKTKTPLVLFLEEEILKTQIILHNEGHTRLLTTIQLLRDLTLQPITVALPEVITVAADHQEETMVAEGLLEEDQAVLADLLEEEEEDNYNSLF